MQIDVIIPTHNRERIVLNAIESVLNQTYQNFTLYIIDDGSTDETQNALQKFANNPKIRLLKQDNLGVSSARNTGIRSSQSEWIALLDSDDTWLPEKLAVQVDYLKTHQNLRFIHTEELWIRNGVRVNPKLKHQKSGDNLFTRSLDFCLISPSTSLIKRDLIEEHGLFDESFAVCEDYDLWLKILSKEDIGFIEKPLTLKHGGHADQLSTRFVAMDYWRIKSLVKLYESDLSKERKSEIKQVVQKKSEILLKGYLKHDNQNNYQEIKNLILKIGIS
jgi:glycosyltransferase involved in cell wall biosynthesis